MGREVSYTGVTMSIKSKPDRRIESALSVSGCSVCGGGSAKPKIGIENMDFRNRRGHSTRNDLHISLSLSVSRSSTPPKEQERTRDFRERQSGGLCRCGAAKRYEAGENSGVPRPRLPTKIAAVLDCFIDYSDKPYVRSEIRCV